MSLEERVIKVLNDYRKPIEISNLVKKVNNSDPYNKKFKRKEIMDFLLNSEHLFIVDSYNQNPRIWALAEWNPKLRSLYSYTDWDSYEPRIGKVIISAYNLLKGKKKPVNIESLRGQLPGIRHHVSVLTKVFSEDPLFLIEGDLVSLKKDGPKTFLKQISDNPNDCIADIQKMISIITPNIFVSCFITKYPSFFIKDNLEFWTTLCGIKYYDAFNIIKSQKKIWLVGKKLYVYEVIRSTEQVIDLLTKVKGLAIDDLSLTIYEEIKKYDYVLEDALINLPFSREACYWILSKQDKIVMISNGKWMKRENLPIQMNLLSSFREKVSQDIRLLIIKTIQEQKRPLLLEEIIYYSVGVVNPSLKLKALFVFGINLIPDYIYKIEDSNYFALSIHKEILRKSIIDLIINWLEQNEIGSLKDIINMLKANEISDLSEVNVRKLLLMYPSISLVENDVFSLKAAYLDENEKIAVRNIVESTLERCPNGININTLFEIVKDSPKMYDSYITKEQFKTTLKEWGMVAIVRPKVYLMDKVPKFKMRIGDIAYCILKEHGEPMEYSELENEIRKGSHYKNSISSILLSEIKLSRPSRGLWGLREWGLPEYDPEIHKQISGLLINILEVKQRPMHKSEIREELNKREINIHEMTLHMDLLEEENIHQVARGVYALKKWNLKFNDLIKKDYPFKLSLPDGDSKVFKLPNGVLFEYLVTSSCLESGRILIRKKMAPYFEHLERYSRINLYDIDNDKYLGWADHISDNDERFQILGVDRWYKNFNVTYGNVIYVLKYDSSKEIGLYTTEQIDFLDES